MGWHSVNGSQLTIAKGPCTQSVSELLCRSLAVWQLSRTCFPAGWTKDSPTAAAAATGSAAIEHLMYAERKRCNICLCPLARLIYGCHLNGAGANSALSCSPRDTQGSATQRASAHKLCPLLISLARTRLPLSALLVNQRQVEQQPSWLRLNGN